MFEGLTSLIKTKEGKQLAVVGGVIIGVLTGMHYYHSIKLNRLKIKEQEKSNKDKGIED